MAKMLDRISKSLGDYYDSRADSASSPPQQVGWKSEQAQCSRFDQLIKVIETGSPFSLNDYGCGQGDFSKYLSIKGFTNFEYHGYDMLADMIEKATKRYAKEGQRHFLCLTNPDEMKVSDYTVASGVFNLRFAIPDHEWLNYIKEMISAFNSKSTRGLAFNALTKYSDKEFMKEELYYADPCQLFDFCKRNFSKNVALLHDYHEYDFTIIVKK